MTGRLEWMESLGGPQSLGTAEDVAVVGLEDPGVVDIARDLAAEDVEARLTAVFGMPLPAAPWSIRTAEDRMIVALGTQHWRAMLPRGEAAAAAAAARDNGAVALDRTGGFSLIRIAGEGALEVLRLTIEQELAGLAPLNAVPVRIAEVAGLVVAEGGSVRSYLAVVPRSYGVHVAERLVAAARPQARLGLFRPQAVPTI